MVMIDAFEPGLLKAKAASMTVEYLNEPAKKSQLITFLEQFSGIQSWKVELSLSDALATDTPISKGVGATEIAIDFEKHPTLKELTQIFPGTSIESVRQRPKTS
jgi:hypothetical protein